MALWYMIDGNEMWIGYEDRTSQYYTWYEWTPPSTAQDSPSQGKSIRTVGEGISMIIDLPSDCSYLFAGCTSLNTKLISTRNVTNMCGLFQGSTIASLNLSDWNVSKVTNMQNMFKDCTNLTKITIDEFDTSKVTNGSNMFLNCASLVGGSGTVYNSSNTSLDYAKVDSPRSPGYFTSIHTWEEVEPWIKENGAWVKYEVYM